MKKATVQYSTGTGFTANLTDDQAVDLHRSAVNDRKTIVFKDYDDATHIVSVRHLRHIKVEKVS